MSDVFWNEANYSGYHVLQADGYNVGFYVNDKDDPNTIGHAPDTYFLSQELDEDWVQHNHPGFDDLPINEKRAIVETVWRLSR